MLFGPGDRIHAWSTIDLPHLFCENSNHTEGHFSLFPVSDLQAGFYQDGADNGLSTTSASIVPHLQSAKVL